MSFNLRNRSLLTVQDYTPREFRYLLDLARDLKRAKYARTERQSLKGKNIALIFEKTSTRTRCASLMLRRWRFATVRTGPSSGSVRSRALLRKRIGMSCTTASTQRASRRASRRAQPSA
jgi:hypothetical protein